MAGLHRAKGGPKLTRTVPSEREGLALAVGAAMQWSKLRDSNNPQFFLSIAVAVKDCEGTERNWQNEDMTFFVQQRLFGGIPQYAVEKWIQREFLTIKGAANLKEKRADVIQNFMYKYLSPCDAGVDFESSLSLAAKANLGAVLQCRALGGYPELTVEEFLVRDPWDDNGGKAGLKAQAKKLLTMVAAAGRKVNGQFAPINPFCSVCNELKFIHMGDRCKLEPVPCGCDAPGGEHCEEAPNTTEQARPPKRTRGFGQDLDPTCEGIFQSYSRYVRILGKRYPDARPKAIIKKLLGEDVAFDWDAEGDSSSSSNTRSNVTGSVGGKILVCFLLSLEDPPNTLPDFIAESGGVAQWLQAQLPKCALFPAAKLCIEKAIKHLPKYEAGLEAARQAAGPAAKAPKLFEDSDDDE